MISWINITSKVSLELLSDNNSYNHKTSSDKSMLYPLHICNLAFKIIHKDILTRVLYLF